MLTLLLVAQIVASAPPLSPAQAAAILSKMDSISNRTHVVALPPADGPRFAIAPSRPAEPNGVFQVRTSTGVIANVVFRPLNCCDRYVTRLPRGREGLKLRSPGSEKAGELIVSLPSRSQPSSAPPGRTKIARIRP